MGRYVEDTLHPLIPSNCNRTPACCKKPGVYVGRDEEAGGREGERRKGRGKGKERKGEEERRKVKGEKVYYLPLLMCIK